MRKYIVPVLLLSFFIATPCFGLTATDTPPMALSDGDINIWEILDNVMNWFFNIVVFIAAIMVIFAGWQYVTAAGDSSKTKKALDTLVFALIGLGIALLSKGIIYIVGYVFKQSVIKL